MVNTNSINAKPEIGLFGTISIDLVINTSLIYQQRL